ncbi:putative toxin [Williamsia sp. CHRR-6]|uniref:putative toxin n=1 Tax=Williamsia sp. CHRR-6 TaxID=2835871 RepID=UPI001BD9ADCE|nr:putative toxin [Williamsia sp. CHRR-6]MBT0567098.1 hypothetical protein [Williamsia sp. CHRR-6]
MRTLSVGLSELVSKLRRDLRDVPNSAGHHMSAGHSWATAYDQAASDVFEAISLTAVAADNLGTLVHSAGSERMRVQNLNTPGRPDAAAPALAQGSGITTAIHPEFRSTGGRNDPPDTWHLIEDRVTKKWADCDVDKIRTAGEAWTAGAAGVSRLVQAVPGPNGAPDPPPEVPKIDAAVDRVCRVLDEVVVWGNAIATACAETQSKSDLERRQITAVLQAANIVIAVLDSLPGGPLPQFVSMFAVDRYKEQAARDVATLLTELDGFVGTAVSSLEGITGAGNVTNLIQLNLSPMLGRYARPDKPISGNTNFARRGAEGERRAGIPPGYKKTRVYPKNPRRKGGYRYPDFIDRDQGQVTEVKNVNDTRASDDQIADEAQWAEEQGYTMTLIVDHRTVLSPDVVRLESEGDITVVRMELDDNLAGQAPTPFVPRKDWTPPVSTDPANTTQTGVPAP